MRTPQAGERLSAADGTDWRVKSVFQDSEGEADEAYDPDFFLVTLAPLVGDGSTEGVGMELDNQQFQAFCEHHGIRL